MYSITRCGNGCEDAPDLLLESGADTSAQDNQGLTAPHHPPKEFNQGTYLNIVQKLLQAGADTSIQNIRGRTVLHHAATSADGQFLVPMFLDAGADHSIKDHAGWTALHNAVHIQDET